MENQNSKLESIKFALSQLKNEIESSGDKLALELGILKILDELQKELNKKTLDRKRIEQGVYGIFRLVTESFMLEKSPLGQELLKLRGEIREFTAKII